MPPAYGRTSAGFTPKPTSQVLADMQASILGAVDPQLDLSAQTPDGQMLGIYANDIGSVWEVLQACDQEMNRQDAEGAALDNIGDLTGTPREGESYTQVLCTLTFAGGAGPYTAGQLVANVTGQTSQTFSNLYPISAAQISAGGGTLTGVVMQSTTPGQTPAVNPATLTAITAPVTGWNTITNPLAQSQLGTNAELDPTYMVRQVEELAGQGGCTAQSTAAQLVQLGAAQSPPVSISPLVLENRTPSFQTVQGVVLPPNSWAPIVYDSQGWSSSSAGQAAIGALLYANLPPGITLIGTTYVTVQDAILGPQTVAYTVSTAVPIYLNITVAIQPNATWAFVQQAIITALVQAAIAPTPATGIAPLGQLTPGIDVLQSQMEGVVMSVPGVFDVQAPQVATTFGGTGAIVFINANQVGTLSSGKDGSGNLFVTVTQEPYP